MASASYVQDSFIGGEVSKSVQGQFSNKLYRTWMSVCTNGMPMEQMAWTRRPGSQFLGTTRGGAAGRVFSFDFKQAQPYVMEFTSGYLRFFAGPTQVTTNDQQAVVSISTANPAKVKTFGLHGWSTGNTVAFNTFGLNIPTFNHLRLFVITVTSTTEFTLVDALTGITVDGASLGAFVSGFVGRILEIATVYTGITWSGLRVVQTDIKTLNGTTPGAILLHASFKPYMLQVTTPPAAGIFASFSLIPAVFKDGPYFDPVGNGALITPSAKIGVITLTLTFQAYDATVAYSTGDFVTSASIGYQSLVDANLNNTPASSPTDWMIVGVGSAVGPNGFTAGDVGRQIRLFSEPPLWVTGTSYTAGTSVVMYNNVPYKALSNHTAGSTNTPDTSPTTWAISPSSRIWSWGRITALSTAGLIDPALAGSVNVGNMTLNGGLAAAFDGSTTLKTPANCAAGTGTGHYIGKDYTAAAAQTISSAVIYPSSSGFTNYAFSSVWTLNLRGKATAPANSADGTLLGTLDLPNPFQTSPVTIISTNIVTTYNFVWIEITSPGFISALFSQVQFYSATSIAGSVVSFQVVGPALLYTTAVRTWRMGLYSDTTGWPTCGTYHEGRLWLSGTIGNRIDGSVAGGVSSTGINFAPTNSDGSVAGNNAIDYTFDAPDVNPIFWMQPDAQGIVCGTQGGEWLVQATTQNVPLTPTTIQAHRYTKYNCANIEPRKTNLTLAVVQAFKRELLEYFADVYSGRFSAHDLALYAKHLVASGIIEIGYQQELIPTIWSLCGNGTVVGMTYSRATLVSSQPPDIAGWHRVTLGSGRSVESICIGSNTDGTLDSLVMVTNDNGERHVEMLSNVFMETDNPANAWMLDDAVRPTSTALVVASVSAPYGGITLNGLWHLNGAIVQVFAAGLDCGLQEGTTVTDFVVSDGSVFVPFGDGISAGTGRGLFTATFAAAAVAAGQVVVGYTYNSDGQLVRPNAPAESGARNGPAFGKLRRNQYYMVLVNQTAGLYVGTNFDSLDPVKFNAPGSGTMIAPIATFSGVFRDNLKDDDSYDGMFCWRISRPLPATIAAAGAALHTSDI